MSKILILGGTGYTGRLIAQHLLEHSKADITIATRHLDGAQAFADKLNRQYPDHRVKAIYADASQKDSLHRPQRTPKMSSEPLWKWVWTIWTCNSALKNWLCCNRWRMKSKMPASG